MLDKKSLNRQLDNFSDLLQAVSALLDTIMQSGVRLIIRLECQIASVDKDFIDIGIFFFLIEGKVQYKITSVEDTE